jgi:hypothetical protein
VRLLVATHLDARADEEVADIKMKVGGNLPSGGNLVDVDVEGPVHDQAARCDARLLLGLAAGSG